MTTTGQSSIHRSDRDRIAVLSIDTPGRSMNVVDEAVLGDLADHVDDLLGDVDVDAIVLTSGKPGSFGGGADVSWLPELAAREDAADFLASVHELMLRVAESDKPLVAALNGPAFGGAFELALAAREIVAVPAATVGLPEVTLHLLPGGGGTQLLTRFVTPTSATELLTSGRKVGADEAVGLGLVSLLVDPADLVDVAVARATALAGTPAPVRDVLEPAAAKDVVEERRAELQAGRGGLTAAASTILDVLAVGLAQGLRAGLAAERDGFLACLRSPEARAAMHLFQAEADVRRRSRSGGSEVTLLGVVGGGQMGAGLAATAVSRGLAARVRDVSDDQLRRAGDYRDRVLARTAPADGPDARVRDWTATTAWDGFDATDAVIEAVFESPEVKDEVLREVSALLPTDALLASNTSAIPIHILAASVTGPERFLGMHFFSPVDRMPLVELIPHDGTAPHAVQRAAALGRRLGKVPVVVGDAPGFFTSRVYARWLMEGIRLLLDGVPPAAIDAAAIAVGFPVGPLLAHDEATLDLVLAASVTQVAEPVLADRMDVASIRAALETLIDAGVRGRRYGTGFYTYDEDGRRGRPNDDVGTLLGVTPTDATEGEIGERLLLAFTSECLLCWDDGTLCHPDDGDVAAVLGIGFPRILGGPFHWADELGAAEFVRRCHELGEQAFPPGEALLRLLKDGGHLGDEPRRPAPFQPAVEVAS